MTTVRKTEPDDYSTFRGWLTTTENVISYTGTDFSWEDFDDSDNPEMSATVARHIRSHTMVDDRGTALGLVVAYPNFDYPWVWNLEVFVDPAERSAGRGSELLRFAVNDLFNNTFCTVLEGIIAEDNDASLAAFQKFGDVVGRINGYFKRKESADVGGIRVALTKEAWRNHV